MWFIVWCELNAQKTTKGRAKIFKEVDASMAAQV
jgi:hypothetical protein